MTKKSKTKLRSTLLATRDSITAEKRNQASKTIAQKIRTMPVVQDALSIFCYLATESEVNTDALLSEWIYKKTISVPYIDTDNQEMVASTFTGFENTKQGVLGIRHPIDIQPVTQSPQIAIIPGVSFSKQGDRLGYGKGYYDKWLAKNPDTIKIAIAFSWQIYTYIPTEPHDVTMQFIVTEDDTYIID